MKAQFLLLTVVLLFAAGCSGPEPDYFWYHPERTLEQVKADYAACELNAELEAVKAVEDRYFDRMRSPTDLADGEQSAKKKKSDDPALQAKTEWAQLYKQNAFNGCMQSRGYVQLKPDQISAPLKTKKLPLGALAGR